MAEKKRYELLDLMRFIAILLVMNSHFDPLYPIPALATGGAMGNALFFVISGYLLNTRDSFLRFSWKRFFRMYPGVFIMVTLNVLQGWHKIGGWGDFFTSYLWPTAFWFVGALALFDILVYILDQLKYTEHFVRFTVIMAVLYLAAYILIVDTSRWSVEEPGLKNPAQWFKMIYYFHIYAMGHHLREKPRSGKPGHCLRLVVACVALFVFSLVFKYIMVKFPVMLKAQFLCQWMGVVFAWAAMALVLSGEESYRRCVVPWVRRCVSALAALSLELYLVQFDMIRLCTPLPFPMNILCTLAGTFLLAFLLNQIDRRIFRLSGRIFAARRD